MLSQEQRDFLLPKAYNAAIRAGKVILDIYETHDCSFDMKSDHTPITLADRASHELIKEYLGQTRIPILSEEGREMLYEERKGWDLFWIVDPLDGTKEFLKGNGEFTINIALMENNAPVMSVVYVPYIKKIYFCDDQQGAFLKENISADASASFDVDQIFDNTLALPLTKHINSPVRIAVSRSHNTGETFEHIEKFKHLFPDAVIVEQGSSFKFCLIAEGTIDYYVRTTNTYEWDTAAGEHILNASGGKIVTLPDLTPLAYNKPSLLNPHFACTSHGLKEELHVRIPSRAYPH